MSEENTVLLQYAITDGSTEIKSITLRRPTVNDSYVAQKFRGDTIDQELNMFASLSGLTPATLKKLDMADYMALQELYKSFLPSPPMM